MLSCWAADELNIVSVNEITPYTDNVELLRGIAPRSHRLLPLALYESLAL